LKLFAIETYLILRILVGGTMRREFGLCDKSAKLWSVLPCFDAVLSLANCQVLVKVRVERKG